MPYYIEALEGNAPAPLPEGIEGVSDITFLDPCQGSGHVLVYAFDLFTKIYEEEGYNTSEIPALIMEHNLFGIDIDERAAQLAAFALTMKARNYFTRFLRMAVQSHVIALENVSEEAIRQSIQLPITVDGKKITEHKDLSLYLLTQVDNFGSLIQIAPEEAGAIQMQEGSIWQVQQQKLKDQADYLSRKYHCVVTNPPYMGGKGMNDKLKGFIEKKFEAGKNDLMTCFMQRCGDLLYENCFCGMINLPSWLFLSSFEPLRKEILKKYHIDSLIHMGRGIFGIDFGSVAFIISKSSSTSSGVFFRLHQRNFQHIYFEHIEQLFLRVKVDNDFKYNFDEYRGEEGISEIPFISSKDGIKLSYIANQKDFEKIPRNPIGYWLSEKMIKVFKKENLTHIGDLKRGMTTSDNDKFLRFWPEVERKKTGFGFSNSDDAKSSKLKWFPYNKGGWYRKWYGCNEYLVDWENDGENVIAFAKTINKSYTRTIVNVSYFFLPSITWPYISSGKFGIRFIEKGSLYDSGGPALFKLVDDHLIAAFLNSKVVKELLQVLAPTINYQITDIACLPSPKSTNNYHSLVKTALIISKEDWNSNETSWDFSQNELVEKGESSLESAFQAYSIKSINRFFKLKRIEEEINREFIEAYELYEELTPEVPLEEITILQDEAKIVNGKLFIDPVPVLLQLLSYSIGCNFGRYSLDKPGLILADQSQSLQDFLKQIPSPTFMPDEDNIIPVLDGGWFTDDIVDRFKVFLKAAFGEDHFEENIKYVEETIGKDIRKYFVKDFYNDHIKRYKKRPIYWMFSSPKGHFKAIIYMHRYQPDLCSKLLTDYLQSFIHKLEAAKQTKVAESLREDLPARERTAANKEADRYEGMIKDCKEYAQILYAVATKKIEINLDDGVKVNYQKFKEVLVPIRGLEKDEE